MTEEKVDENLEDFFEKLQCQFLCCYPARNIDWKKLPKALTWEQQQQLVDKTYNHPLNQEFPVKIGYQLNFFKRLLQQLEQTCPEVHDSIYESFCEVQQRVAQDATQKYAYKHYLLSRHRQANAKFTLRESKSFVAEGTTGLCSWQASLALADYLLQHEQLVRDRNVLELGAGTGLCGLIATRCCGTRQMVLTDGSIECVELMRENVSRNFPNANEKSKGCFELEQKTLMVKQLLWDEIHSFDAFDHFKPDLVLAADVVYDDSVFEQLTNAIDFIFGLRQNNCKMLLAATVRNEHTLSKFLQLLGKLNFHIEEEPAIPLEQSHLFWDRTTAVKILIISKND